MHGMGVHRQIGEPDIVGLGDRSPRPVFVDITNLEILIIQAGVLAESILKDDVRGPKPEHRPFFHCN